MDDRNSKKAVPSEPIVNQSVKGLSIVRSSLLKSGHKQESPEVKKIDDLITHYKK